MKYKRQSKILELINELDVCTQDELAERLGREGYTATQATISRDIKELKLIKIPAQGGQYKYSASNYDEEKTEVKFFNILTETVINIKTAGTLIVVRTYSGMASAAAEAIDNINFPEVIGTIAGDNTIFIAFANDESAGVIAQKLEKMIK